MEKIHLLAKQYCIEFEKNDWRNKWVWISILVWIVFVVLLIVNLGQGLEVKSTIFWLLLGMELLGLLAMEKARKDRRNAILKKYNKSYSNMFLPNFFKDVDSCKRHFLSLALSKSEKEYLSLACELNKAISLQDSLRSSFDKSVSRWYLSIYNPESKQRINAWLIVLFSTLMLLSIRDSDGANLSNVFEFYSGVTFSISAVFFFFVVALFGLLFLTQSLFILILGFVFSESNWELKYLLRDLIKFHDF